MKFVLALIPALLVSCATPKKKSPAVPEAPALKVAFEITEGISHPESALYSPAHQALFVSNVTSGNPTETKRVGHISKYGADGKVIAAKWVTNLKAPKGMAIVGDALYVSDVNEIVKIDAKKGKILKTWKIPGALFLNDVAADKDGNVYVSDMNANVIHKVSGDKVSDWIRSPQLRGPNGLFTDGQEHILMVQWGSEVDAKTWVAKKPGHMMAIMLKGKPEESVENNSISGHLDGIASDKLGNLYVSDWMSGDIWYVKKNGLAEKLYNFGQGTADISVSKELNLLFVPQMSQNKVIALQL